jgi:mannose-6-phosphate isomerase-like protein (cupin superfamily)
MRIRKAMVAGMVTFGMCTALGAQATPPMGNPADVRTQAAIDAQAKTLLADAQKNPSGNASVTLEKYPGHLTMLTVRTKAGGAEVHAAFDDFFIVEDGEATVMTGGTVIDPKEASPGEMRGSGLEGATPHIIRKGDVMHISPGVPHQTMVAPGKTFTYYVIKVAEPQK